MCPIVAMGPSGGPVVDLDSLLVGNASRSLVRRFGSATLTNHEHCSRPRSFPRTSRSPSRSWAAAIACKRFTIPSAKCRRPTPASRHAKPTSGSATSRPPSPTSASTSDDETRVRYINRWHLQKRDSKLKLSPPKEPIRFYVEHTAPVRYRRWIKAGIDYWNKAFEKVGLVDAIVIEYQDAESGVHMEKDPEDVRYNFIRWLNNDVGTAIGPSRVHPSTGEILDADIILTDGWIRHFNFNYEDLMPKLAMEGVAAETLAWLGRHPRWDPRVRMAPAEKANYLRS